MASRDKKVGGKTLLEIAREMDTRKITPIVHGPEEVELALAWARGQVRNTQVLKAISMAETGNVYNFLAHALRQYVLDQDKENA